MKKVFGLSKKKQNRENNIKKNEERRKKKSAHSSPFEDSGSHARFYTNLACVKERTHLLPPTVPTKEKRKKR